MKEKLTKIQEDIISEKNKSPQVITHQHTHEGVQKGIHLGLGPINFSISW